MEFNTFFGRRKHMRATIVALFSGLLFLLFLYWLPSVHPVSSLPRSAPLQTTPTSSGLNASAGRIGLPPAPASLKEQIPGITGKDLEVPVGVRLMVFSPHPDDETLVAGGLIQRVLENGGTVRVVFVTNGDGYMKGVRTRVKKLQTSSNDFVEYGEKRHDEAMGALRVLGLQPEDGIFLGFPDDGIDDLWAKNWSKIKPYTSPYTQFDRPEYKESFNIWTRYAGTDLKEEIAGAVVSFMPDWIVSPDPRDYHPDHCTTGVFVLEALRQLKEEDEISLDDTQILTYLVHFFDYPASPQWIKEVNARGVGGTKTAGQVLASTQWVNFDLTPAELATKKQALAEHRTQVEALGNFLKEFMRPNELFCRLSPGQVLHIPLEYAAYFKRPSS
jgi:LmbE family N-acetylglucosaminyl deacetylase